MTPRLARCSLLFAAFHASTSSLLLADGKLSPPRDYKGSLEETSQEAILVFTEGAEDRPSHQEMILKISVRGEALSEFAWVVPFPSPPELTKADGELFRELFDYVESRRHRSAGGSETKSAESAPKAEAVGGVEVISRKIVGVYDTAVVRETDAGALNAWLKAEGFRELEEADEVLESYRAKKSAYACIKVSEAALSEGSAVDLHPLRFSFSSGGRDGIFFPMRLTGLQTEPFDVNLYVFHRYWINDRLSQFGYTHRGFQLNYRDWDSPQCVPNGGKDFAHPESDPFLKSHASRLPRTTALMKELAPDGRFYLTNIQARNLRPADVRRWKDDLWLFPYYTNRSHVPYDAQPGGPAAAGFPDVKIDASADEPTDAPFSRTTLLIATSGIAAGLLAGYWLGRRRTTTV